MNKTIPALSITLLLLFSQSLIGQTNAAYNNAAEAIHAAQNDKQYLFLLFYDKKGESLKAMESAINDFRNKTSEKSLFYKVRTTDKKEKDTIAKYGIERASLPVLLVFAPNGAVTGGFPGKVSVDELKRSMVTDLVMDILKTMQGRKIALVLLQNSKTKFNKESLKAAEDFSNDARLKGYVDIIKADPRDSKNSDFLNNAKISKDDDKAAVVFIVPPGSIVNVYKGNITKDTLMACLAACTSGGSGSSKCCPR